MSDGATPGERLPGLREGVELELSETGGVLTDRVFGRRIKLDARGAALCRELSREVLGDQPAPALEELAAAVGSPIEVIGPFADKLLALDLVASERALKRLADRRALAAVRAEPARHLRVLPEARFECTMCGSCCGGHNVGPVSSAVLAGLDPAIPTLEPVVKRVRHVDKDLFVILQQDVMCHVADGSCLFLDDGGRCRIHSRLGGQAKPLPCRVFPWELVATPAGLRVTVQRECRDFVRATSDEQPLLSVANAELSALLEELEQLPEARLTARLGGQELASWADWEALEGRLLETLSEVDPSDQAALFRALVKCLPANAPSADEPTFGVWRERLSGALETMLRAAPPANERVVIRVDSLAVAIEALTHARGWVLQRALEPLTVELATLLKEHLRHAIWATTPLLASSVEAGIGRLIAEWLLARVIAITRARQVKRFHVTTQDVQDGLVVACFLFRHDDVKPLLQDLDETTAAVFVDGLETLLTQGASEGGPDGRLELVKF